MGTGNSYAPFELKLQLHGQVSNPYTFNIKSNYKASAVTTVNVPDYTEKSWTTPGAYTWTVPAGVSKIRVAVCGGGGGAGQTSSINTRQGSSGGTSSFSSISATGGGGGYARQEKDDYTSNITYSYSGGTGGTPNGRNGTAGWQDSHSGGAGFALSFILTNGSYGQGGNASQSVNSGGGSGGYISTYLTVTSNSTVTIKVGSGGSGSRDGGSANSGNSGFVLIAYGQEIE